MAAASPAGRPDVAMMNGAQGRLVFPALPAGSFTQALGTWCQKRGHAPIDHVMLEGRRIELRALHQDVLGMGGPAQVRSVFRASHIVTLIHAL